jgi:polar amino acid transport system substrate-binding protein
MVNHAFRPEFNCSFLPMKFDSQLFTPFTEAAPPRIAFAGKLLLLAAVHFTCQSRNGMRNNNKNRLAALLAAAVCWHGAAISGAAAESAFGHSWDPGERLQKGDLTGLVRVRFLTTLDYPPFSYLDSANHLTGFNVDLARALCDVLDIAGRCQIQAMPWEELQNGLKNSQGEAVISGVAASGPARQSMIFSRPYMRMAARLAINKRAPLAPLAGGGFGASVIGAVAGSSHERMLRAFFPKTVTASLPNSSELYNQLRDGKVAAIFGDAMGLSFWLQSAASGGCCEFSGEAYYSDEFLGNGMRIALKPEDADLMKSLNFALKEAQERGVMDELYLKYFPVGFY